MEPVISDLVTRFERGLLTRRELIGALAILAGGATSAQPATLKSATINHVSVLVTDMARSMEFYDRVFGLKLMSEDKANRIARLGTAGKILVSLRVEPPPGVIDHYAIGVDGFNRDAVTADLKGFGLTPADNIEFGFHVKDPDGAVVQITGV